MEADAITITEYLQIIKRRKWSLILPALIVFIIAIVVASILPPTYKSASTILIEEQEIPQTFVMATVTSFAEQRLQSINQRIMSSTKLLEIIKRFSLYQELQGKWTLEEIISKMREDIKLETISAEVMDRRTGRPSVATIAFTLSYEGKRPDQVQQVANMLTSLYLEENLKVRERQTMETYAFLEDEMNKVKIDLNEIEKRVVLFKEKYLNELPELLQVNVQTLNRMEQNIDTMQGQLRTLKEKEGYFTTQLASIPKTVSPDKQRLKELKVQLLSFTTRFAEEHPDLIKTRAEIAELEKQIKESSGSTDSTDDTPDNPAYIALASQLAGTRTDIDSVKQRIKDLETKKDKYQQRIETTPKIEQEYNLLMVERNNTRIKFDDLMKKVMEAKVAYGLEKEQKGERFTLIDSARFPEKPYKPNRLAIVLIGLVLAIGAGVGTGSLKEFSDNSVRSAKGLSDLTSFPVLAGIPEIKTEKDIEHSKKKRIRIIILAIIIIIAGIAAFHFLVMDLYIFWAKLSRLIGRQSL